LLARAGTDGASGTAMGAVTRAGGVVGTAMGVATGTGWCPLTPGVLTVGT